MDAKKLAAVVVLSGLMSACANMSPLGGPTVTQTYSGYITPISTPIKVKYTPAAYSEIISYEISIKGKVKNKVESFNSNTEMQLTAHVSRIGDFLSWNIKMNKYFENGRVFSPRLPLAKITLLTDNYGDSKGFQLSSPALKQAVISKEKKAKILKQLRTSVSRYVSALPHLPKTPIKTGDVINVNNLAYLKKVFQGKLQPGASIKNTVEGWGVLDGRKVIVTSVNGEYSLNLHGTIVQFRATGYDLIDPKTFATLRSYMAISMNTAEHTSFADSVHGTITATAATTLTN